MLVRFRFENFGCFKDRQELSMIAATNRDRTDLVYDETHKLHLLRVAAIYGANASGKSTVLEALEFVADSLTRRTHARQELRALETFQRLPGSSWFEVIHLVNGVLYEYSFRIHSSGEILEERLSASPGPRKQRWFDRDASRQPSFAFGRKLGGENAGLARVTPPQQLFLATAAASGHPTLTPVFEAITGSLAGTYRYEEGAVMKALVQQMGSDEALSATISWLRSADVGITGIESRPWETADARLQQFVRELVETFGPAVAGGRRNLAFLHESKDGRFALPLHRESRGTQAWLMLGIRVAEAMRTGGMLLCDELDASLHPLLVRDFLGLFKSSSTNPLNAQLVFTTHDVTLLDTVPGPPPLDRDEVWILEKQASAASSLFSLSDYKVRKDENFARGYLMGRYGGVPSPRLEEISVLNRKAG
jgi:uncharacterized protein